MSITQETPTGKPRAPIRFTQGPRAELSREFLGSREGGVRPPHPPLKEGSTGVHQTPNSERSLVVATPQNADGTVTSRPQRTADALRADTREAYVEMSRQIASQAALYKSPTVFCEAMMSQIEKMRASLVTNTGSYPLAFSAHTPKSAADPIRVATATWALDILASAPGSTNVLKAIRDELFPALFVNYGSALEKVKQSVKLEFGSEAIKKNPFLACDFFVQVHEDREARLHDVGQHIGYLKGKLVENKGTVNHMIDRSALATKRNVLAAWRGWAKNCRVERFAREVFTRHGRRETRRSILDGTMARWRLTVEQNRTASLQTKVNTLEFQIENAKNQFQLQCYRSDKYLRLVEELREEFGSMRDNRDGLANKVREMETELKEMRAAARKRLNDDVNSCLQELYKWRRFARRKVDQDALKIEKLSVGNIAAQAATADDYEDDEEDEGERSVTQRGGDTKEKESGNPTLDSERVLLRWVNSVVGSSVVSTVKRVSNFTQDYQNGEVILLLLHAVYPNQVPLSPLQEMSNIKRIDQIVEIARTVGVGSLPRASDVIEGVGDIMVLVTAELYSRFVSLNRVKEEPVGSDNAALLQYDADMLTTVIGDAQTELSKLQETEKAAIAQDQIVWKGQNQLQLYTGFITRERLDGRSVMVLDKKDVAKFCKFAKNRYGDIAFKYAKAPNDYIGQWLPFDGQLDELSATLKRHYQDLRKCFSNYCNGRPMIADSDFWRMVGDLRVMDKLLTRQHIDKIFQIANNDEPPLPPGRRGQQALASAFQQEADDSDEAADEGEEANDDDDENTATELIPSEFVECLVRMADRKYSNKTIGEKFALLMTNHVNPFAGKSDSDKFKKEMLSSAVQGAITKYGKDLLKIFNYFARGQGKASKKNKMMNLHDFVYFFKESNIGSQTLDESAATACFNTISSSAEEAKEIDQREFFDVVIALSVFRAPSPFLALDKKVELLVSQIIHSLRPRLKGSITLTDVPLMTLKEK